MSKSPRVTWFGESCRYFDSNNDTFDANDLSKEQTDYLANHPEVTTLAALFVSRMVQKKVWCRNTLNEAGMFFTRPIEVLDDEIKQEQKRTGKSECSKHRAKEKNVTFETNSSRPRREDYAKVSFSESRPAHKTSVESLYSGFVSESTSESTMPIEEVPEPSKPTLTEFMYELLLKFMNTGLNEMYASRNTEIIYDEAHLCLMRSIQMIVETKWNPIIEDFKELLETMVDDVRSIAMERHLIKLRATDKVPIKVERLKNNYRGFPSEESQPPTKKEILETIEKRKSSYNRYPKDAFGVYISKEDENNSSSSSEFSEYDYSTNSLNSIAPSHRSYASTCLPTMPYLPFLQSGIKLPTLRSIADFSVPILSNFTKEQ